ncbi:MAG: DMT family transporter [Pseudomonadota bacterium]
MSEQSQPLRAAGLMVGAMVSFTTMAVAGRELAPVLDTFEIMMYRSFVGIVIVLAIGAAIGGLGTISTGRLGLHGLRNLVHFTGQNLWFYALIFIPLSQLFAFEFTNPLWVAVLAPFLLRETMTRTRIAAFCLGFLGILIVARPESAPVSFATFAAAACAICFALTTISTKKLGTTESTLCIMFWLTVMQAVMGIVCAGFDGDIAWPPGWALVWVALVGVCGLLAHACIAAALKLAPATVVAPLEFLRLPLVAVVAWFLYDEPLLVTVFIGAAIVFAANFLNIRAEQRRQASAG